MSLTVYKAAEAAEAARVKRAVIDAACSSGQLVAYDVTPESSRRSWRVIADDLEDWIRRGFPTKPTP